MAWAPFGRLPSADDDAADKSAGVAVAYRRGALSRTGDGFARNHDPCQAQISALLFDDRQNHRSVR